MKYVELLAIYYVFNAIVSGMPEPTEKSKWGYVWAYRSLHVLSGNLDKVAKTKGIQ